MNERERWIVYPLLFLALGAALRDKLIDRTTSGSIVCKELIVMDEEPMGREPYFIAKIGRVPPSAAGGQGGGFLVVNGQVSVNGTIDGQNYALRGVPLVPSLRAMISPTELLKALQQSAQAWQDANSPEVDTSQGEPTTSEATDGATTTDDAPAGDSSQNPPPEDPQK
jgi:hypothetical protein